MARVESREQPDARGVALERGQRHSFVPTGPTVGLTLVDAASREPGQDRDPANERFS